LASLLAALQRFALTLLEQGMDAGVGAGSQIDKNVMELISIGTEALDSVLSTTQLRGSDHVHRFRDLLGLFHTDDLVLNVPQ
jgi:hypothetical protein